MNTTTIFLAFNEDGDIAADQDRDTAIERLRDDFGGDFLRVIEMTVTLPDLADIQATFTVPADKVETIAATATG